MILKLLQIGELKDLVNFCYSFHILDYFIFSEVYKLVDIGVLFQNAFYIFDMSDFLTEKLLKHPLLFNLKYSSKIIKNKETNTV